MDYGTLNHPVQGKMQRQLDPEPVSPGTPTRTDWARNVSFIIASSLTVPLFLAIHAWRTSNERYRHWLLTALVTVYGSTIIFVYDGTREGSDGVRHLWLVYNHYVGLSFQQFLVELWSTLTFRIENTHIRDPYKHIVSYLVGGVLNAPWLFFTVVAFVYGYFFTGSLLKIFKHFRLSQANYVIIAFAALLFLTRNIEGVNTVRTWTGMWILVYACLRYYETKHWRYIALMLAPPFVHIGFFILVIPVLVVVIFGNRPVLYATLFVASSFTNLIPQSFVVETLSSTERGAHSVRAYLVEEEQSVAEHFAAARKGERRWWAEYHRGKVHRWALSIFVYVVLAGGIYFTYMNYLQRNIFATGLVMLTLSNSAWFLFAVQNRSWVIGAVLVLAAFVMANTNPTTRRNILRSRQPPYYAWGLHLSLLLFLPFFLFNLSTLLDYPSIFWLTAPAVVWLSPELNTSWKELLQIILRIR